MNVTGNLAYKTIPTNKGNNLIMLKNYTFSKHTKSRNYYCSSKLKGCRARFKMDEKGDIIHGDFTHTHDPPKYAISSSGHYIKFPCVMTVLLIFKIHIRTCKNFLYYATFS
ncbi:hypothetical protein ABMA28_001396 [Loxostege sticticalis]|uniref:FLYWCH-type domain-containing protein n=1 Tax=Loxostege sticticalis TaxID=481309 RepID=A0ABD0T2W6_LOXSC